MFLHFSLVQPSLRRFKNQTISQPGKLDNEGDFVFKDGNMVDCGLVVGAKLRVTENRCVLFDSFTCIYINKIIQIYIHTHNSFIYKLLNGIFFSAFFNRGRFIEKSEAP